MNAQMESQPTTSKPAQANGLTRVVRLVVITGDNCPSFKNSKRSILDSWSGKQRTLTPKKMKQRMQLLENRTVSALYSLCRTSSGEMDLECLKRLQTALFGLLDDSLREMPDFSFAVRYVQPGCEGVEIEIERIADETTV